MSQPASPLKAPRFRHTIVEAAIDELRRRILSGAIRSGEALRQDALAKEFGISRIPVREAFRQLSAEGLVTIHPHRGAVVSALSETEVAELFDLRAMLEPDLIRRAVPHQTEADFKAAERILDDYAAAIERGDINAWGELNTEYHLSLYRPADRPQTLELVRMLLVNTDRYTRVQLGVAGRTARAMQEHAEILALCRKRDAKGVAAYTREHILAVQRDLLELLPTHNADLGSAAQ